VGDMIDGIVVGQDILIRVNQKLKFNRILLLVTDGETKVEGIEDLETIATQMINETKIELYVAMIGKVVDDSSIIKKNNAKLLYSLAKSVKGRFIMIDNYLEGIHLFASAPGLCTKPQLPQIVFQLSPTVKIPCIYFSKNMKSKLPSLKKQVASNSDLIGGGYNIGAVKAENDVSSSLYGSSNALKRDTVYRNPDDPDLELDADERVKGYRYGSQYIPLTAEDEEMFKIPGNGGITVIGAVPLSEIARHHFLEGPIIIKGQQEYDCTQQAIASISYALKSTSKALLVRFVKKDKADPVLSAVLASDHPNQCDCLIMHRLPFVDDIRDFLFRSIDVPNDSNLSHKRSIVSSYVDAMTIRNVPSNIVTPSNPILQNAFNVINDKICNCHAISSSSEDLLLTRDSLIDSMMCPVHLIKGTSNRIAAIVQSISTTYQLQRNDVSKSRKKRKKKYWSTLKAEAVTTTTAAVTTATDIISADTAAAVGPDSIGFVEGTSRVDAGGEPEEEDDDEEELLPEFHVGSMNPIQDFELLVIVAAKLDAEDQEIVLLDAMTTMSMIIETSITVGACQFQYTRAVEFLTSFRSASIKYSQVDFFNSFLQETLKPFQRSSSRHQLFWKLLSESNITLISSAEVNSSPVSPIEAKEFLK
jgi:ATP-dependent DNA helicase 2 subunit 2